MPEPETEEKIRYESYEKYRNVILLAILGWTPILWKHVRESHWLIAGFFVLFFLLDLADAIFDLILAGQLLYIGCDGAGLWGVFLLLATIVGRLVSGFYGLHYSNGSFLEYSFMELTVFLIEDGAAILVLAKLSNRMGTYSLGGMDTTVDTINIYLTTACALCHFGYFLVFMFMHGCCYSYLCVQGCCLNCAELFWRRKCGYEKESWVRLASSCSGLMLFNLALGGAIFQIYILFAKVIMQTDDHDFDVDGVDEEDDDYDYDGPLSGNLEIVAFVVYACTALIMIFRNAIYKLTTKKTFEDSDPDRFCCGVEGTILNAF